MRNIITLLIIIASSSIGFSATIIVPDDYPTIQGAIDASVNGDTVLVKPGTYLENIIIYGKYLTVESIDGPVNTIIDGSKPTNPKIGSVVTILGIPSSGSVIDGFTLTGGNGNMQGGSGFGGGIDCREGTSATIINNYVMNNSCKGSGGGIWCFDGAHATIKNNLISQNASNMGGAGGIAVFSSSSAMISNNTITDNSCASKGGGIACWHDSSYATIENNIISGNSSGGGGGGLLFWNLSSSITTEVTGNTITDNDTYYHGGGIMVWADASPIITNNIIEANRVGSIYASGGRGGGISCYYNATPIVTNNMVLYNVVEGDPVWSFYSYGGGIYCGADSSTTITNNTISKNEAFFGYGGGICCDSPSQTLTNSILWNNEDYFGDHEISGNPTVTYCDVQGGWPGTGNIDADPLFVDPENGDFHLTYPSPCKDTGDNSAVTELYDFEGDPRIAYGTVDMGADEFYTHLYWTGNATNGGLVEVKFVGLPNTAPVIHCFGAGILDPPLPTKWGDWYLQFPIIGPIDLGKIPSPDGVLIVPGTIPGSLPPPYSIPMQALIGAELSNLTILEVK